MPYNLVMYVDGGCRGNGYHWAYGACACIVVRRRGPDKVITSRLPEWPQPTNQRAELQAIILALEHAVDVRERLDNYPYLQVTIHTDSSYAYGCMTKWYQKWQENGFVNARGYEVTNRDLIERALDLESDVLDHGNVVWEWIPRCDNTVADEAVNDELDDM